MDTPASTLLSESANGGVRALLRLEGFASLIAAVSAYALIGGSWLLFTKLFLLPDVAIAFYLLGARIGACAYNTAHSTLGAYALAAIGIVAQSQIAVGAALIWLAHIGFDRALGYGLKYTSAFSDTHLGRIGRQH